MIEVNYWAYDLQSRMQQGKIAAATEQAAIDAIYELGLTPYETKVVSSRQAKVAATKRITTLAVAGVRNKRVSLKQLSAFTTELASLANSGLAIDDALRIVVGPGVSRPIEQMGSGILQEMLSGSQLSEALERRSAVFGADYRAIVRAGEMSGAVGQALSQIAELLSRRLEIRRKIAAAMVYPSILLGMSILSIAVIVIFLLPSLAPIFADANRQMPAILSWLIQLQENWILALLVSGGAIMTIVLLFRNAARNASTARILDRIKVAAPIAGELIRLREASRFARALGTLLTAGVPVLLSLQTSRGLVSNGFLSRQYDSAIDRVPEGLALHEAFGPFNLLPASALRLVTIGEETGQLGQMLLRAAGLIESDYLQRVERLLGLLTPLMTLTIGGAVGSLIMAVMSAVLSINELALQ